MPFKQQYTDISYIVKHGRKPDFANLIKILNKRQPSRYTLFEFFLNEEVYAAATADKQYDTNDPLWGAKRQIDAFYALGYDYATLWGSGFYFNTKPKEHKSSHSANDGASIWDSASYEQYKWNEPSDFDYSHLKTLEVYMNENVKLAVSGPCGVLENAIAIMGYDNMCYLLADEPEVAEAVFDNIGKRLLEYYKEVLEYDSVGVVIANDDWGFKTQTMLSIKDMQRLVFPWYKKVAKAAHDKGKLILLHSCGAFADIMPDIKDIGFDGRHSYEDTILPVEESYARYHNDIAILGGIDLDYIMRMSHEDVYARSRKMVETALTGYGLGSGNSIASYVPMDKYCAMVAAALFE